MTWGDAKTLEKRKKVGFLGHPGKIQLGTNREVEIQDSAQKQYRKSKVQESSFSGKKGARAASSRTTVGKHQGELRLHGGMQKKPLKIRGISE